MAICHLLILLYLTLLIPADSHNITAVLDAFPEYSVYNSYLSQTKVCDEINSHETVTCLVLSNSAMSPLVAKQSLAGIKNALHLLSLLDYFDPQKLHDLTHGTTLTTTLYQTTGNAPGNLGFVNITNLRGGRVGFASAKPGSPFDATYTKSVKQIPYNLSVLEISAPITFPGLMDASSVPSNLTALLEKAGCKIFASLITSSGVLRMYQSAMDKGFTLFAPNDDAFKADGAPDLTTLSSAELVTILQYHALPSYTPKASLKTTRGPIATMASSGSGKYDLSVITRGDDVSLDTGVDTSRVASTVVDNTPVCVLTVDNLLLPSELFGNASAPTAPGPVALTPTPSLAPATAPAPDTVPAPAADAPAPSPHTKKPTKKKVPSHSHTPPAPPESPDGAPSDAPAADVDAAPDDIKDAAMRSIASPASLVLASICIVVFLL